MDRPFTSAQASPPGQPPAYLAIRKSDTAEVRVSRSSMHGRQVVDIRIWYQPTGGAEYVPSRKGVAVDAGKLPDLIAALQELA